MDLSTLENGQNIEVGDSFRYYAEGDFEIQWESVNANDETLTGILIQDKIYHIVAVKDDPDGKYIQISEYHPGDKFADAAHNRERLHIKCFLQAFHISQRLSVMFRTPYKQITIEIYKEFIDINSETPANIAENGNLKTLIINKFFRMVEKPGAGSVISAEGTVAIDLAILDDITPLIDNVNKIYDVREQDHQSNHIAIITFWLHWMVLHRNLERHIPSSMIKRSSPFKLQQ